MTHDLLAATVRLAGTLEAENVALRALNLPAAVALLAEKQAATDAFDAARNAAPPVRSEALRGSRIPPHVAGRREPAVARTRRSRCRPAC